MPPQEDPQRRPTRKERRAASRAGRSPGVPGRGRIILGALLGLGFVLLVSLRGIAVFYTDHLWFESLGLGAVFNRVQGTKLMLAVVGGVVFFVLCWANLLIAERLAPVFRPSVGDDDLIERYHEMVGRRAWMVRFGVSLLMALLIGVSLGAAWNEWILFRHGGDFGVRDATFKTDIGFYVFRLPFLISLTGWLFSSLLVVFIMTVLAHVVNGGIRFHTQIDRVTPQVKAHLSVLLGLLALVQMGRYWLARYELTFSTRGTVDGATYTDANVEQRALYLLMLIAVFAFGLFIANIWRRGWVLPVMAVSLWVLVAVLASAVVPAFVQRFRVEPTESSMERDYIVNNIEATQAAYGLSNVERERYDWQAKDIPPEELAKNAGTLSNVRLWDPTTMQGSYEQKQEVKSFYKINDVDVDRYLVDGVPTPVMIAARDLSSDGITSWEASHLTYTHGYGVVVAKANDQTSSGDPVLLAEDIPVKVSQGLPEVKTSAIYFGEKKAGYVVVDTKRREIDYQDEDGKTAYTTYQGEDGVQLGSGASGFARKAAFALRFGDINPLVSANITPRSKLLMERDVRSRLQSVAPFLAYDHDPYAVIDERTGGVQYVVDAYTTTRNYPNAQRADTGGLDPSSGLYGRSFNYVRNSVKAVVDAYDGTVTLYVVDDTDPIIAAYRSAFPELFTDGDDVPDELRRHFRYPEDLFTVQTQMWAKYHVTDPDDFYNGNDEWSIPKETGASNQKGDRVTQVGADGQKLTGDDRYPSSYQLMQLPGEDEATFVIQRPYVTSSDDEGGGQNQLRALIVASSDPETYGELRTYTLPVQELPEGPNLAAADIRADGEVADKVKALCTDGKRVCTFASPSILPVGGSLLYVQTFLVDVGDQGAPKIEHVIVNYRRPGGEGEVALDSTLYGALSQIFTGVPSSVQGGESVNVDTGGEDPEPEPTDPEAPPASLDAQQDELVAEIAAAFDAADKAARDGDLVAREREIARAAELFGDLERLRERAAREAEAAGTPTTDGPTATAVPDPTTTTTTTAGT